MSVDRDTYCFFEQTPLSGEEATLPRPERQWITAHSDLVRILSFASWENVTVPHYEAVWIR